MYPEAERKASDKEASNIVCACVCVRDNLQKSALAMQISIFGMQKYALGMQK